MLSILHQNYKNQIMASILFLLHPLHPNIKRQENERPAHLKLRTGEVHDKSELGGLPMKSQGFDDHMNAFCIQDAADGFTVMCVDLGDIFMHNVYGALLQLWDVKCHKFNPAVQFMKRQCL
ncbi:hypothetical protein SRHO_G00046670 [Serrasalmus rhombeus]